MRDGAAVGAGGAAASGSGVHAASTEGFAAGAAATGGAARAASAVAAAAAAAGAVRAAGDVTAVVSGAGSRPEAHQTRGQHLLRAGADQQVAACSIVARKSQLQKLLHSMVALCADNAGGMVLEPHHISLQIQAC